MDVHPYSVAIRQSLLSILLLRWELRDVAQVVLADHHGVGDINDAICIYISIFDCTLICNGQGQGGHGLVTMDAVFHLQGVAVFSVLVHGVGEGDLEVGITGLQRLIGPGDILCHIAGHAVGVVGRYLHTGGVEGVFYIVGRLVRQLRDLFYLCNTEKESAK